MLSRVGAIYRVGSYIMTLRAAPGLQTAVR
jgi:hypothetical protein